MESIKKVVGVGLYSADQKLVDSFRPSALKDHDVPSNDVSFLFESQSGKFETLKKADVIIYDLDMVDGDIPSAVYELLKIKENNLSAETILIGSRAVLSEAMEDADILQLVARSLNKPIVTSQLKMAISIVSSGGHERESHRSKKKVSKVLGFSLLGGLSIAAVVALILFDYEKSSPDDQIPAKVEHAQLREDAKPQGADADVERNFELAKKAIDRGHLISPSGNNALLYIEQILEADPYDDRAYKIKLKMVERLRSSFEEAIDLNEIEEAGKIASVVIEAAPFDDRNASMLATLERARQASLDSVERETVVSLNDGPVTDQNAVGEVAQNQPQEEITSQRIIKEAEDIRTRNQERILKEINDSIDQEKLIPPFEKNAYSQLLNAVRNNSLDDSGLANIKDALVSKLVFSAKAKIANSDFDDANKLAKYIRDLNNAHPELPNIKAALAEEAERAQREKERAEDLALQDQATEINEPKAKITPFKVLARAEPRYPKRAYRLDIEGWVEVEYQVNEEGTAENIKVVGGDPKKIFNKSAIEAIKAWKFQPSLDSSSGNPVMSEPTTTKFNFALGS